MWLIINKRPWLKNGPVVTVGLLSANGLAEAGEIVEFVTDGHSPDWRADLPVHYGLAPHPNLTIKLIPRLQFGNISSSLSLYLYPFIRLARERYSRGSITIFTRDSSFLPFLVLLKFLFGAKIFLEVHHAYANPRPFLAEGFVLTAQEKKNSVMERRLCRYLNGLICITPPQAELYREVFPDLPLIVLPLGVRVHPSLPPEEKFLKRTLVYVGEMTKRKGLETLLRAMSLVDPSIRLLLIGWKEKYRTWLEHQLKDLGITGAVKLIGSVPPAEVARLCETEASIGVLPLEDNFYSRALTSPAKLGDYQGNGLPVIASRLPTTEYLLNENEDSLFYTPGDVQGLARAITSLFSDKERFIRLAKGSAQSASLRSWKDRSHRLIEFAKSGHVDVSSE